MQGMHARRGLSFVAARCLFVLAVLVMSMTILFFSTRARAATGTIVVHTAIGPQIPVGQSGTLTVSCASGEQLLSGGFVGNAFEGAVDVVANYPSAANSWTVTVNNVVAPSWIQMTVYANCLQASYSLGTTIVQAAGIGAGALTTANCPAGSALLSGGYVAGGGVSVPNSNGWQSNGTSVYALCATHNFTAAPSVSALFPVPPGTGSIGVGNAQCAAGQLATGGGFSSSVPVVSSEAVVNSDGSSTSWSVRAAGVFDQTTATAWVVCVTPTPTQASGAHVTYQLNAQWSGGFSTGLTITNTSSTTVHGWALQFTFPGDQKITSFWNGNVTQSGEQVTITNVSYNGTIAPGQTITLGFNGTWKTNNTSPTSFTLNGQPTL